MAGIELGNLFNTISTSLDKDGATIQSKITELSGQKEVNQADLLKLQYLTGQYNAKMEASSSILKSMQDMLKSLAQRTG